MYISTEILIVVATLRKQHLLYRYEAFSYY